MHDVPLTWNRTALLADVLISQPGAADVEKDALSAAGTESSIACPEGCES
jgi:hypothetical protein